MDKTLNQVLQDLHLNIVSNLESDSISNEETETLIFLDQSILEHLNKDDLR